MMKEESATDSILSDKHLIKNTRVKCRLAKTNEIEKYRLLEASQSHTCYINLTEIDVSFDSEYLKDYFTKYYYRYIIFLP